MDTIGIEEEFFVFDRRTRRAVRRMDRVFLARARDALGEHLMTEMLQSQIEVATPPCATIDEARRHLVRYRRALAEAAASRGLGIAAVGTFPLAFWPEQEMTSKERYGAIMQDLQMIGARNMLCGMHVHVAVREGASRIDLIRRLTPYLPLILALSTSSPFWQGHLSGLRGYRLAAYDELPRTGLPELFRTEAEYDAFVGALAAARVIPDASFIWWAVRPSLSHPTIELRVADSCTRLADTLAIAALFRCLVGALDADPALNAGFDRVGRAITAENKWHAQRHGLGATFVDPFSRAPLDAAAWLASVRALIAPQAAALGCGGALAHLDTILAEGSSADRQIAVYKAARDAGGQRSAAVRDVIDWAAAETLGSAS